MGLEVIVVPTESECMDCASHSLPRGVVAVGVTAVAKDSPVAEGMGPVDIGAGGGTAFELDLKEESRF